MSDARSFALFVFGILGSDIGNIQTVDKLGGFAEPGRFRQSCKDILQARPRSCRGHHKVCERRLVDPLTKPRADIRAPTSHRDYR